MPMTGPAYMHASIATLGLAANHHTGIWRDHLRIVECPNAHIIFPSWCSSQYSLSRIIQHMNYTQAHNFNMALQTGYDLAGWESTFIEAGISATSAKIYAQTFSSEEITRDSLHMLDCMMLKELGTKTMGDVLAILKLTTETLVSPASPMKLPTTKLPRLSSEMMTQPFRKFRIDWDVFTRMTNLPTAQTNVQLYNCADEAVQNSIINTYSDFFDTSPNKLLDMLEVFIMRKSNLMVHWISFSSIAQSDNETVQNYIVQLRSGVQDCDFICPNCYYDLSYIYIMDQFFLSIASDALLVDMLAKAGSLKILEQNISHAKALEIAMRDQNPVFLMAGLQMSAYHQQRQVQDVKGHWLKQDPCRMCVKAAVVTSMVELDQVIGHGCAQHEARYAGHTASKTTLRWSTSQRAWRNEVLCNALGMRKLTWMPSLHT